MYSGSEAFPSDGSLSSLSAISQDCMQLLKSFLDDKDERTKDEKYSALLVRVTEVLKVQTDIVSFDKYWQRILRDVFNYTLRAVQNVPICKQLLLLTAECFKRPMIFVSEKYSSALLRTVVAWSIDDATLLALALPAFRGLFSFEKN
jgi:hypothetical protein